MGDEDGLRIEREQLGMDTMWKKMGPVYARELVHHMVSYYEIKETPGWELKKHLLDIENIDANIARLLDL